MSKRRNAPATEQRNKAGQKRTKTGFSGSKHPPQKKRSDTTHNNNAVPARKNTSRNNADGPKLRASDGYFLFGRNSVLAALNNSQRECVQLIATAKALTDIKIPKHHASLHTIPVESADTIHAAVPIGAPHQGVLLEVRPLPGIAVDELTPIDGRKNIILMLDQVTDPQNVGACIRSAAAFGARAIITQDRNSPQETGTLARAAAGTIETVPWVQVTNLSQALDTLKDMGYWHVGLDGNTNTSIRGLTMGDNIVIVMGSEGSGLRPLIRKNCDMIARIPMTDAVESLNVAAAATVTLYELSHTV